MRRFTVLAVVLGVALAACGRNQVQTRQSPLVLLQDPGSDACRIVGADEVRGYRGDTIQWPVQNHCARGHQVRINFTNSPGASSSLDCPDATKNCTLAVVLDAMLGEYKYSLEVDHAVQMDPRPEIDPHR